MLESTEFEETMRFSEEDLADVMRQVHERQSGVDGDEDEEDDSEAATEMMALHWEELEPLDSETAAFSLDAPALKTLERLEGQQMPHGTPVPVHRGMQWPSARQTLVAMAAGSLGGVAIVALLYILVG
jgi:hypothetical protein